MPMLHMYLSFLAYNTQSREIVPAESQRKLCKTWPTAGFYETLCCGLMRHIGFANARFTLAAKRTRKRVFLDEMNLVVPWAHLSC